MLGLLACGLVVGALAWLLWKTVFDAKLPLGVVLEDNTLVVAATVLGLFFVLLSGVTVYFVGPSWGGGVSPLLFSVEGIEREVAVAVGLVLAFVVGMARFLQGAPFVGTPHEAVDKMVLAMRKANSRKMVDIGSGDGRILIAAAKAGIEAHGYESNGSLVAQSVDSIKQLGLEGRAFVHHRDFWGVDMSRFDAACVFGIPHVMQRLEDKLQVELRKGAVVVAYGYKLPTWSACEVVDGEIYVYRVPGP